MCMSQPTGAGKLGTRYWQRGTSRQRQGRNIDERCRNTRPPWLVCACLSVFTLATNALATAIVG